ncbi:MAG: hypothetical protein ACKO4T_09200 [Planctomycetaceae bacterium]
MAAFLSGISIVCFAASYGVALACEASRLVFRSGVRGAAMVAFAAAGLVAHTLFLVWRAVDGGAAPLSSPFDWYLLAAWTLAAGYLWLTLANPRTPVGLFLLPIVLGLVGAATLVSREPFLHDSASRFWGRVHGGLNLVWSVSVVLGAIAGGMWLIQAGRLARKQPPLRGFRMPSLERLAHVTARTPALAAWTAAAGFASGIVLNAVNRRRGLVETVPWTDPVVLRMAAVVAWLAVAAWIGAMVRRRPDAGRITARIALVSLAVLVASVTWGVLGQTRHGRPPAAASTNEVVP